MYETNVSIFTQQARATFIERYATVAEPADVANIMARIPSKGAIENHAYLSPTPGIGKYDGVRKLGNLTSVIYPVVNDTFDGGFVVGKEQVDDDQVAGFLKKAEELAEKSKIFPSRRVLWQLARGQTDKCFDGTAFFATSHTQGSGNNITTFSGATSDSTTHYIAALITDSPIKPLFWQDREAPFLDTDAGTPQSRFARQYRYWADLRGGTGYGYWWDAVFCTVTNTPTPAEFIKIVNKIKGVFRGFTLPSFNSESGTLEYVHEQRTFSAANLTLVVSTGLEAIADIVSKADVIDQTTNTHKGQFKVLCSAFMNSPS
jgi:phage major head subunit gpT-like protein